MGLSDCRLLGSIARTLPFGSRTFAGLAARLAAAPGPGIRRTFHGPLLSADLSIGYHRELCFGLYERALTGRLGSLLAPGALFLDVGANIGFFSLLAARLAGPTGRVLAFEADPGNVAALRANLALNEAANAEVVPMAAGDRVGKALFVTGEHSVGSSLENAEGTIQKLDARFIGAQKRVVEVEMTTLDSACLEAVSRWPGRKVMKMDIEGVEPLALKGAAGVLRLLDAAFVESNPFMLRSHGFQPGDIVQTMLAAGFRGLVVPDRGRRLSPAAADFDRPGNLLFVREPSPLLAGLQ